MTSASPLAGSGEMSPTPEDRMMKITDRIANNGVIGESDARWLIGQLRTAREREAAFRRTLQQYANEDSWYGPQVIDDERELREASAWNFDEPGYELARDVLASWLLSSPTEGARNG